jgi:hypothetical protein
MASDILRCCTLCGLEKPISDFYRRSGGNHRRDCKACAVRRCQKYADKHSEAISEYKKQWNAENEARLRDAKRLRYLRDPEHVKRKAAEYGKANPARVKAYKSKWKQGNPHKAREYQFVRGQAKRKATPAWANRAAMLAIFRKARELTTATGVEYHVDHIIPVLSQYVCGLHCEQNMQILQASANISKLNRWWPDMWEPL